MSKGSVTPFVGVWIETLFMGIDKDGMESHPSWVCGLKPYEGRLCGGSIYVTPFVGVWIETFYGAKL